MLLNYYYDPTLKIIRYEIPALKYKSAGYDDFRNKVTTSILNKETYSIIQLFLVNFQKIEVTLKYNVVDYEFEKSNNIRKQTFASYFDIGDSTFKAVSQKTTLHTHTVDNLTDFINILIWIKNTATKYEYEIKLGKPTGSVNNTHRLNSENNWRWRHDSAI